MHTSIRVYQLSALHHATLPMETFVNDLEQ